MKKIELSILIIATVFFWGCASSTTIKTLPSGFKIKLSGNLLGITPFDYWDREPSGAATTFTLEKEGYKSQQITIKKDCLYVHRFFSPPLLALPWLYGYMPEYLFEMEK